MNFNKLNVNTLLETSTDVAGVLTGGMAGHLAVSYLYPMLDKDQSKPVMKKALRGGFIVLGILGASLVNGRDTVGKALQSASLGVAVAQTFELLKDILTPDKGTLTSKALGMGTVGDIYGGGYISPSYETEPEVTTDYETGKEEEISIV